MKLKEVSGKRENKDSIVKRKVSTYEHDLKILLNRVVKDCAENAIPIFIAFYSPNDGYVYNGVLPEEIDDEEIDVSSEYGKFFEFLRICIGYNKEEFLKSNLIRTYGSSSSKEEV